MKTILYKAKRIDNGEWIEGYGASINIEENLAFIIHKQGSNLFSNTQVFPETVCQFIGLMDKNGNNIFENDRVKLYNREYVIKWHHCMYALFSKEDSIVPDSYPIFADEMKKAIVINNLNDDNRN